MYDSKYELSELLEKAKKIGKLFNINFKYNINLPSEYLCFHLRGNDKARRPGMWDCKYKSNYVIEQIKKNCKLPVVLLTDETPENIKSELNIDINQFVIIPFNIQIGKDSWMPDYTTSCIKDMYIMQNSKGIIQHSPHGWSSFSNYFNIVKNTFLISSCDNNYNIYYPDIYSYAFKRKWRNFFNWDEVDEFIKELII